MPNTPVRAAAEGMPNVNRRNALTFLSAGMAAAAMAPSAVAASAPASTVNHALSAYKAAEDHYSICQNRETSITEALGEKLFPKWTMPGGVSSRWTHVPLVFRASKALESEIARKRVQVAKSFADGLMNRSAYDHWMKDLTEQGDIGMASLREQEAVIEASGYNDAYQQADDAFYVARDAFLAVLAVPCQAIEEVRAKAACVISGYNRLGLELDGDDLVTCMSSLCGEA
ncbi:hypothetical protein [Mesorhizobium sp. RIZ17]|uniref:hypothetical protein n=1 Tax=Mesorhizobium sp. RIZ17 TaxID=3132743 RepID=UPI003DA9DA87